MLIEMDAVGGLNLRPMVYHASVPELPRKPALFVVKGCRLANASIHNTVTLTHVWMLQGLSSGA